MLHTARLYGGTHGHSSIMQTYSILCCSPLKGPGCIKGSSLLVPLTETEAGEQEGQQGGFNSSAPSLLSTCLNPESTVLTLYSHFACHGFAEEQKSRVSGGVSGSADGSCCVCGACMCAVGSISMLLLSRQDYQRIRPSSQGKNV